MGQIPGDANNIVEWASEIGDLSYLLAPDPEPTGIQLRLRVISIKTECGVPNPLPVTPSRHIISQMFDAVNWMAIPSDAENVAGYDDGKWSKWPQEAWDKFPNAYHITVLGNLQSQIADCESGDLTEQQAADWYHQKQGFRKVYIERSKVTTITALGVPVGDLWVADWTGIQHSYFGSWATQYANPDFTGADYDLSLITS